MSDIRRENEIEEYQKLLQIKGELNYEQIVTIDLTRYVQCPLYVTIKGNGEKRRKYTKLHHNEFLLHVPLNRSKLQRDKERDISEQIALGLASAPPSQEALYDQRLFNQSKVMYGLNQSVPNVD